MALKLSSRAITRASSNDEKSPISDASDAELAAKADALYADLLRALTTDKPPTAALRRRLRAAAPPSDECMAGG